MAYPDFELILHAQDFPVHNINCQPPLAAPAPHRRTTLAYSNQCPPKHLDLDCTVKATQEKKKKGDLSLEDDPTHLSCPPRPRARRLLLSDLLNPIVQVRVGSEHDSIPTQPSRHLAIDTPSPLVGQRSKKEKRKAKAGVFTARKAEERRKREERRRRRERSEEDGEGALRCLVLLF